MIFDETVFIGVTWTVDPGKRLFDRRPKFPHRLQIPARLRILSGEQDEQRRSIDAAIVTAKGNLPETRHLTGPRLVQDLSGLSVRGRIEFGRLHGSQSLQDGDRNSAIEPQALKGGDKPVATEGRRIPGNAGVRVEPLRRFSEQHGKVDGRAPEHLVEAMV